MSTGHIRYAKKILIVIAATVALLALIEITLRGFFFQDITVKYEDESLGHTDIILGHINRPNSLTKVKTPEFSAEYWLSKEGLRDVKNHSQSKDPKVKRILILGDSFTFGVGNTYEDIWPVVFENHLMEDGYKAEIIKAGVPAYDTTKEVLLLERIFPLYKPDVVIIVFLPNDLFTNTPISEENYIIEDTAVRKKGGKDSNFHLLTLYKRILISIDWVYAKLYLMTERSAYFSSPSTRILEDQLNLTKELLLRAARYCKSRNAEFIVLSVPQQFQVLYKANDYNFEKTNVDLIDEELQSFAKVNGFTWVSVLGVLAEERRRSGKELYFRLDGHLNKDGNKVLGDYFYSAFTELYGKHMNIFGR